MSYKGSYKGGFVLYKGSYEGALCFVRALKKSFVFCKGLL